jgi:hypothetical protein
MKYIILIIFLLLIHIGISQADQFDVDSAVKDIIAAPDWTVMNEKSLLIEGDKIIKILAKYCDLPSNNVRMLIQKLSESGDEFNLSIGSKIYILNRMFFNVPEIADRSGWKFFGGWAGVPINGSRVSALFPLSITDDGLTKIKNVFGGYSGASYRGLEEFDFFLERYGRRIDSKKK